MKTSLAILAGLAVAALAAAEEPRQAPPKDLDRIQGVWTVALVEHGGQPLSESEVKELALRVTVHDDHFTLESGRAEPEQGTLSLETSGKHKGVAVTFSGADGKRPGVALHGCYELDGDTLKVCLGNAARGHEHEFRTTPDAECVVLVLKRQKP